MREPLVRGEMIWNSLTAANLGRQAITCGVMDELRPAVKDLRNITGVTRRPMVVHQSQLTGVDPSELKRLSRPG